MTASRAATRPGARWVVCAGARAQAADAGVVARRTAGLGVRDAGGEHCQRQRLRHQSLWPRRARLRRRQPVFVPGGRAVHGRGPLVLAAVQAVLASLAVPVLYLIAERPFGRARAVLGAALVAFHPGLMAYTLKLHPLGLDVLLLSLLVWWGLQRHWSSGNGVLAGLTLGLNLMTRPTFFVAGLAAWLTRWRQHP